MKNRLLCLALLALTACSSPPERVKEPTIADLDQPMIDTTPSALEDISAEDVRKSYEALAAGTSDARIKAIALSRIGDLELEEQETEADKPGQKTLSQVDYQQAIQRYRDLLVLYPDYPDNARVLYQLAKAYELAGDLENSLTTMDRLVKEYPSAPYYDEIQFRRGEILFTFRDYEAAETAYAAIIARGPDSEFHDRALYKHGWSQFKRGDLPPNAALTSFVRLLDRNFSSGKAADDFARSESELLEDTLRVMVVTFSLQQGPDTATAYFAEQGRRPYEYRIYQRLGDLYVKQERPEDAIKAYRQFVLLSPAHTQAPFFQQQLITLYGQIGKSNELIAAKAEYVNRYGVGTDYWENQFPVLQTVLTPSLKSHTSDLARHYHAAAQKSKRSQDYAIAGQWYQRYVNAFPQDQETPHMNFLLAETLFEAGNYAGAAKEYERTAYDYPSHPDSAEAGYAALLANNRLLEQAQGEGRVAQRRAAIASAIRFGNRFTTDPRRGPVVSKAAEEALELKDYAQAADLAGMLVSEAPEAKDKTRQTAWAIIAASRFELGDYPAAEAASLKRLQVAPADDPDRKVHLERLAAAIYKQGEEARAAGRMAEAADHFLRVGQRAPDASIRVNADFDAAASLSEAQQWQRAIPVWEDFIKRYPKHELKPKAVENLALAYEESADWRLAATRYEEIYLTEKDPERRRALLWRTAELYDKGGERPAAIKTYQRFAEAFPQPLTQALEAHQRIADHYRQLGDREQRRVWLQRLVTAHKEPGITDRSRYLAAVAALEIAEPGYEAFTRVKLIQPMKDNLKKKKDLLQQTIDAYSKAADFGVAEVTTAALYRIALTYDQFSRDLLKSERPKNLSADELEEYAILLEDQALPFEDKAISVHQSNIRNAYNGVYDEWVKKSYEALRQLLPIQYDKTEKTDAFVESLQ